MMILTRIIQGALIVSAGLAAFHMVRDARRGRFLVVFMTARLMMMLHGADVPLYEVGQDSAPVYLTTYDCGLCK